MIFQLTPSRRATWQRQNIANIADISTHALTEGDQTYCNLSLGAQKFQLTPSRRATIDNWKIVVIFIFQLTPSRRATANLDKFFF